MGTSLALGNEESSCLEFMDAGALKSPGKIAQAVVAMLNAGGGEIWVGVSEERNRATSVEGIPDPYQERWSLRAYLADTIEPTPVEGEIAVDTVKLGQAVVLRVSARPHGHRGPYAYLQNGGRYFVIRQGIHNRWMDREEIFGQTVECQPEILAAVRMVSSELKYVRQDLEQGEDDLFWLRLQPTSALRLRLEDLEKSDLLVDPVQSGNRRVGFVSFAALAGFGPRMIRSTSGKAHLEVGKRGNTWLRIYQDGGILFTAPLVDFWAPPHRPADPPRLLWPLALLEYPVSVFRIAARLYSEAEMRENASLVAHMAVFGLEGWTLRPGSPRAWTLRPPEAASFKKGEDFILERPLIFSAEEIARPDACGLRLVQRLYEGFGFSRDQIPQEFDRQTGRLILPE